MIVEALSPDLEPAYEMFLRSHPGALFYSSLSYRRLLLAQLGCADEYLVAHVDGAVRGILPLMRLDDPEGAVYNSLPYYGSNGGVLAADGEAAAALTAAYAERALAPETISATVIDNPFAPATLPPPHTILDERIAHFTPLGGDPLERVEASARRNVRRAGAAGIRVRVAPDALGELHRLHDENIRALGGLPKTREFFERVARTLAPDQWRLYVAELDGVAVAALLLLYYAETVEYFTPAIDHRHRSDQPLAAILARAMADATESGFARWNWGGTWLSQDSLRRFKVKWGAEERAYSYFVQVNRDDLFRSTAERLRARFGDFYALPFGALHG